MVLQAKENSKQLDPSVLLSCLTKYLQLLGNVNDYISSKKRTQVLTKIGQKYTSLSNEIWENNGRGRFGPQIEQRLNQWAETARTISSASFTPRGKQCFSRGTFCPRTWQRGDATIILQELPRQGPVLSSYQIIQRKWKRNLDLFSVNSTEPNIEKHCVTGMPN